MIFKSKDRGGQYLRLAADLTGSGGWRQDAVAYAAYESEADVAEGKIRAVFVLQNLDALGADLHLAMAPGRRMTRMVLEDLARFLFGSARRHGQMQVGPEGVKVLQHEHRADLAFGDIRLGFIRRIGDGILSPAARARQIGGEAQILAASVFGLEDHGRISPFGRSEVVVAAGLASQEAGHKKQALQHEVKRIAANGGTCRDHQTAAAAPPPAPDHRTSNIEPRQNT
jgi:hypothetical protein